MEVRQVDTLSDYKPRPEPNNLFMMEGCKRPSLGARLLFQRVALVGKEIKLGSKLPYCRKSCTDYHSKEAIDKSIKIKAEEDKMLHAIIATEKYPKIVNGDSPNPKINQDHFPNYSSRTNRKNIPNDLSKRMFYLQRVAFRVRRGILELNFRAGITFFRKTACIFLFKH